MHHELADALALVATVAVIVGLPLIGLAIWSVVH
jgi:hypothetical protein